MKKKGTFFLTVILSFLLCGLCFPVYGADPAAAPEKAGSAVTAETTAEAPAPSGPDHVTAENDSPVGVWKLIEMDTNGEITDREKLEAIESMNMVMYMEFKSDGTFSISGFGEDMEGTWDESSLSANDNAVPYTIEKDTIILQKDSSKMTFERTTIEEIYAILGYQEGILDESIEYSKKEQTILDTKYAAARITGYNADPSGFTITIRCENKTNHRIMISTGNTAINRCMISPTWVASLDAEESRDTPMIFKTTDLAKCGISAADEVILTIKTIDPENYEILGENTVVALYPTGKKAEEIKAPDHTPSEGEKVLVGNDDFTFAIQGAGEDALLGYCADCYIENKTGKPLTFMWTKSRINGTDISSYYAEEALPGTRGYSRAAFMQSALEDNKIEEIKEIKFTLQVLEKDTYNKIYEEELTWIP